MKIWRKKIIFSSCFWTHLVIFDGFWLQAMVFKHFWRGFQMVQMRHFWAQRLFIELPTCYRIFSQIRGFCFVKIILAEIWNKKKIQICKSDFHFYHVIIFLDTFWSYLVHFGFRPWFSSNFVVAFKMGQNGLFLSVYSFF